ncbi:helix-turn-helix domain-containing protein [Kitasatospora sp. NPDC058218]|uniref:helix-turn-helix domain-containing protein n=1 Tax=Kitasatospora sp. NPDC058218 TaxID=3346385 RepID=UPI0036DAAD4B
MAERGRGGRKWGPIRAATVEAEALAVFLRAQVDASGLTMTTVAERIHYSKTQTGLYLSGRVPELKFVRELVRVTVADPRLRERRWSEVEQLLHAANHPAARTEPSPVGGGSVRELEQRRVRQVETYERLTRALEQQTALQEAARNSAQLIMVLLSMISTLEARVESLSADRADLLGHAGDRQALGDTQRQLSRALDQERRANEELDRARDKQRQAEDLAARVQQQVRDLTDELDRLRADVPTPDEPSAPDNVGGAGTVPGGTVSSDPVGNDIDQALAHVTIVNDADDQTLQRITDELQDTDPDHTPHHGQASALDRPVVVPDNQDNPPTVENSGGTPPGTPAARPRSVRKWAEGSWLRTRLAADRVLNPDHPEALIRRHMHAYRLGESGQRAEAARLFALLAEDLTRVQGPDEALVRRYHHAFFLGESGQRAEAARLLAGVVQDTARIQGPHNPFHLSVRYQHAFCLGESGQWAEAVQLLETLYRDSQQTLSTYDSLFPKIWEQRNRFVKAQQRALEA